MKSDVPKEWSTKELLYLGSAVCQCGQDNWNLISKTLISHGIEKNRPPTWYEAESCAKEYQKLLARYPVPKRSTENQANYINTELKKDRIEELQNKLQEQRTVHDKLLKEMNMLDSGDLDSQLDHMWQEILDIQALEEEEEESKLMAVQELMGSPPKSQNPGSKSELSENIANTAETKIEAESTVPLETDVPAKTKDDAETSKGKPCTQAQSPEKKMHIKTEPVETDTVVHPLPDIEKNISPNELKKEPKEELSGSPAEKRAEPAKDSTKTPPKVALDAAEIARREAINELYDNITDEHDVLPNKLPDTRKKALDKPPHTDTPKGDHKKTTKRNADAMNESCDEGDASSEPARKKTRSEVKKEEIKAEPEEEDKRRSIKEETDDEESRDSSEVKEILMFPRSERRRVYGHDDAASPVISESTPSSPASTYCGDDSEGEKAYKSWKKAIMLIWNDICAHKYASVFHRPVTDDKVRGYHSIVYKPTDLQTIKRQVETASIRNTVEFERELMLMFINARMYNTDDHEIAHMASTMMRDVVATIQEFNNVQCKSVEQPHKSLRRETREHSKKNEDSRKSLSKRRKN